MLVIISICVKVGRGPHGNSRSLTMKVRLPGLSTSLLMFSPPPQLLFSVSQLHTPS